MGNYFFQSEVRIDTNINIFEDLPCMLSTYDFRSYKCKIQIQLIYLKFNRKK